MLGVGSSIWNRALSGKGDGDGGNPPAEASPIHSLDLTAAPSASNAFDDYGLATSRTVTDYNGRIVQIPADAVPMGGLRPVRNLWPTADGSDTPSTQVITVESGRVYQLRIGAESASGATAVCSGAFTGTLTGDGADIQAFDTGKTATTTSLTVTITGSVRKIQLQDITHRADLSTAPDEYVSTADDYGTGVNGFRYFDTELANTVASNVVTEAAGASIAGWLDLQPDSTNLVEDSADFSATAGTFSRQNIIVTVNQSVAPDGSNSADLLDDGTATGAHRVYNSTTVTAGAICCSCYAKVVDQQYLSIRIKTSATNYAWAVFDLVNGTVNGNADVDNAAIDHDVDGNGWSRIWMSATTDQTSDFCYFEFSNVATAPSVTTAALSYTGANNQLFLWGAQLETGTIPTAYIPTTTGSASRPAMSPAPTISGLVGTEDARLTVKGVGPELVTNGTFDTDTTGWTPVNATLSVDAGRLKVTTTAGYGAATQTIAMTAGQSAWISFTTTNGSAQAFFFAQNGTIEGNLLTATSNNPVLWCRANNPSIGVTAFFDDISIRVLDPVDTTSRIIDLNNIDGEFDMFDTVPIKVLSIDVYNDGERPA